MCSNWEECTFIWWSWNWGVLEPIQANPVIIEDNCFIGARSEVAEGVIVREGSVLSMGVYMEHQQR